MPSAACRGFNPHTARAGEGDFDLGVDAAITNDTRWLYTVDIGVFVNGFLVNSADVEVGPTRTVQEVILTRIGDPATDPHSPIGVGDNDIEVEVRSEERGTMSGGSVKSDRSERVDMQGPSPTASCGSLAVLPPFDPSKVSVSSCPTFPDEVEPGETVTFDGVSVSNGNESRAEFTLSVYHGGSVVAQKDASVSGNAARVLDLSWTPQSEASSSQVNVVAENVQPADGAQSPQAKLPGLPGGGGGSLTSRQRTAAGVVASAGAVAAASYLARRG